MNTLVIKDLPVAVELDRAAMTAVSGGRLPQQIVNIIQAVNDYANDSLFSTVSREAGPL